MESFSEQFRSMEEVKASVESMKGSLSSEDYELMLYLFGLLENRGLSESILLQGQEVKIGRFLVPMIVDLNARNIVTLACCSGLQSEHLEGRFRPESGYLAIAFDTELLEFLLNNLKDSLIQVSKSECYLKPSVSIIIQSEDDSVLRKKWNLIWNVLKEWHND